MKNILLLLLFVFCFNPVSAQVNEDRLHNPDVRHLIRLDKEFYSAIPAYYKNSKYTGHIFWISKPLHHKENLLFDTLTLSEINFNNVELPNLIVTDGITVDTAQIEMVLQYKNGLVVSVRMYQKGRLYRETSIVNRTQREYSLKIYYQNGQLQYDGGGHNKLYLSTSHDIEDVPFVEFFPDGKIKKKGYFGDKSLKEDYFITKEYNKEGDLRQIWKYNGIKRPGSLNFRNDDYVIENYFNNVLTGRKTVVNQNSFSTIDFFENGGIKKEYYPGGNLKKEYDKNGAVVSEFRADGTQILPKSTNPQSNLNSKIVVKQELKKVNETDVDLNYFQGTFASTSSFLWVKVTIKGRNVSVWTATSQSGEWGEPKRCVLKEWSDGTCTSSDRLSNGSKYYRITTKGCRNPEEFSIMYSPSLNYGKYTYQLGAGGDVLRKVNANFTPWD